MRWISDALLRKEVVLPRVVTRAPVIHKDGEREWERERSTTNVNGYFADVKLPYFKLANRCASMMKTTLVVRSVGTWAPHLTSRRSTVVVHSDLLKDRGFRVYLRFASAPVALIGAMGEDANETWADDHSREMYNQLIVGRHVRMLHVTLSTNSLHSISSHQAADSCSVIRRCLSSSWWWWQSTIDRRPWTHWWRSRGLSSRTYSSISRMVRESNACNFSTDVIIRFQ